MVRRARPFGVVGVFLVILGVGVILDADWRLSGLTLIALGTTCLVAEGRQGRL